MTTLWQDIVYGFRTLLKKPGFTIVAALSLALGIAANTVIFSLINTTLLRALPYPDPSKIVVIWSVPLQHPEQRGNLNVSTYFAFRDRSTSYDSVGAFNGTVANIGADQDGMPAERINGPTFTPSIFKTLGVKPALGRAFLEDEVQVDNTAPVMILSDRLWKRRFNSDPKILGKSLLLDKVPTTIIGVMPSDFSFFGDDVDYVAPQGIGRLQMQSKQGFLVALARLKPGVSIKQAQVEADTITAQLAIGDPERNQGKGARLELLQEAAYGGFRQPLLILQGAVAFVLLIGCANVAGLLLARASSRRTEIAIRSALGAGRWRIVRQLMTESFPLSFLGGVLGLILAWGGLKLFVIAAPPNFPRLEDLRLDSTALLFTALVVVLTGFIFGVVPALQASKADVVNPLKEAGRSGTDGARSQFLRSILVTAQIALALILLIGAGLMINSFLRVQKTDLGADPSGILTFDFRFPQNEIIKPYFRYRGVGLWDVLPTPGIAFTRVWERMQNLPGVISAAASDRPPLTGQGIDMAFLINGRPAPPPSGASSGASQEQGQTASYFSVTPNFFATLKIPIQQGRDFTTRDDAAGTPVIIINQTLARRYFPNEDPVGKHITLDFVPDEKAREIVAVVGDTKLDRFQNNKLSVVYVPYVQQTSRWLGPQWADRAGMYFVLRTSGDPLKMVPAMRQALAEVDPNKPAGEIRTVEAYLDRQVAYLRLYIFLLGIFGAIALILAGIGIYGVMAYSVAERTREIGVRMALGAGPGEVLSLIVRKALMLISIGLIIGLAGSFALTRVIKTALVGVTATDPATFIGVSLLLACFALLACLIPTRRAVRVDPNVALRYE